jgi:hypothetical protein
LTELQKKSLLTISLSPFRREIRVRSIILGFTKVNIYTVKITFKNPGNKSGNCIPVEALPY